MKNILITGANGYLGSHLIEQLSKINDFSIYAFDLDKKSDDTSEVSVHLPSR